MDTNTTIDATIMALREELMQYFKGTCIHRLTTADNISWRQARLQGGNLHRYQRDQYESKNEKILFLGGVPILTVKHTPDIVIFHKTLERSEQLRAIKVGLEEFFNNFLRGVHREISDAVVTN